MATRFSSRGVLEYSQCCTALYSSTSVYLAREQRAANVRVWHLALMNRSTPANVMSELKKYLTLDHAQCERLVMSDSTNVQNY